MKLIFVTEARFTKDKNGKVFGDTSFNKDLWIRYLTVFSHVYVMARVKYDEKYIGTGTNLSSAEKVTFIELPYFIGPIQYLQVKSKLIKIVPYVDTKETANSIVAIRVEGGDINLINSEFKDITIVVENFVPFTEWTIKDSNLRPFAIMGEIQKSLKDKSVNGLGKISGGDFSLNFYIQTVIL